MASNPVSSFFTRFRRDKSKERQDPKKRLSVPVFSSSVDAQPDVRNHRNLEPSPSTPALQGSQDGTRSPKNERPSNKDNKKSAKKENKAGAKKGNALSYLLCMSRNADTIDRQNVTGLPPHPNKAKSRGKSKSTDVSDKDKDNESANKENKKFTKNKKPPKGWFSTENIIPPDFILNSEPSKENIYGPMYQPTRGPSQGVRYRVDGTLEKPYVFPSGFTFGPEGRKLKLRRSTPDFKSTKSRSEAKLENVHVDIHLPASASDEFDPDKEFSLKFDSPRQSSRRNLYRYSMPEVPGPHSYFPSNNDVMDGRDNPADHSRSNTSHSQSRESSSGNILNSDISAKKSNENKTRSSGRRSRYTKNRYSMPPKNDEFVYMGSFENLHLCDSLEKRQNAENERMMKEEMNKEKRRNRYSMSPKNPDCVYMGSFENLTFQFTGDKGAEPALSLPKKDASLSRSYSSSTSSKRVDIEDNRHTPNHEMITFNKKPTTEVKNSATKKDLNVQPTVEHKDNDNDIEDDTFDEKLPIGKRTNFSNPFCRNAGRSSGMPGNKRSFAPPPAIFEPVETSKVEVGPKSLKISVPPSAEESSDGMNFKLPPPPNHTPSWEEMEKVQVRLSEIARGCHKGSQADISSEEESISMEERDKSLCRENVEKISSASSQPSVALPAEQIIIKKGFKKEVIYDVPKPTVTLPKQTRVELKQIIPANHVTGPKLNKSSSSDDSVFDSPLNIVSSNKPNIQTHSVNANNSYINVEIKNIDRKHTAPDRKHTAPDRKHTAPDRKQLAQDRNHPAPESHKTKNDYEFMYLCSTPQVSIATQPQSKPLQKTDSMRLDQGYVVIAPQASSAGAGGNNSAEATRRAAVVTSTPKVLRRLTLTEKDSAANNGRPVPSPRKRSEGNRNSVVTEDNLLTAVKIAEVDPSGTKPSSTSSSTQQTRAAPVPKKRTNLSYSSSACSHSEAEKKFKVLNSEQNTPKENNHHGELSASKGVQKSSNVPSTDETKHIYEDVEINKQPETKVPLDHKISHYEVCGSLTKPGTDDHNPVYLRTDVQHSHRNELALLALMPLTPVHTLKLASSPMCKRRSEGADNWSRPIYTGLSTSASGLAEVLSPRDHDYSNWLMSAAPRFDDDDTCVADDELSACNEDDYEDVDEILKVKRGSMRKWASADDIIRSGSIIDRSMILAKKRRLRKRQKKSSQPVSSGVAPVAKPHQQPPFRKSGASDNNNNGGVGGANNIFAKNKKPSNAGSRGSNLAGGDRHRLNHTDSGHDSDIISPCASPSAIVESYVGDVEVSNPRRQASASRKSWEVRLQNLQWQRKIRSRENLSESLV